MEIKELKDVLMNLDNFYHGTAIIKEDISETLKKGRSGLITAYLPEMNKFAVYFVHDNFQTFNCTEEEFLYNFEIIQEK